MAGTPASAPFVTYGNQLSRNIRLCLEKLETIYVDGWDKERITNFEVFGDDQPCEFRITTNKKCRSSGNKDGFHSQELEAEDDNGLSLALRGIFVSRLDSTLATIGAVGTITSLSAPACRVLKRAALSHRAAWGGTFPRSGSLSLLPQGVFWFLHLLRPKEKGSLASIIHRNSLAQQEFPYTP
ncbi:unnamed protein product [Clonostachys rhizophaga]|uniref:Uncharacterized protein n=1 Tax=Clonostachys rhizophaga TaxID=160324 RepID=A0A9N9VC89_9HYPO|nr:unnamed protein product [Clonostachys rhizophaga]